MFLDSEQIKQAVVSGELSIEPFNTENLKAGSYTFTLDVTTTIGPGGFLLGKTIEKLTLNNKFGCFLSTRGSLAQQGIDALQSSIYCEPDTDNVITLEISNCSEKEVTLERGQPIVKAIFYRLNS